MFTYRNNKGVTAGTSKERRLLLGADQTTTKLGKNWEWVNNSAEILKKTLWRFLQLIINTYNFPSASLWRCVDVCLSQSYPPSERLHASGSRFNVPRMCHLTGELHALLQPSLSIWPLLITFEIQLPSCHWIAPFNICLCMQLLLLWSLLLIAISFWCRGLISFVN